jgi:hypothetical protein
MDGQNFLDEEAKRRGETRPDSMPKAGQSRRGSKEDLLSVLRAQKPTGDSAEDPPSNPSTELPPTTYAPEVSSMCVQCTESVKEQRGGHAKRLHR